MCPSVFPVSAVAITYVTLALIVKKIIQVEINTILALSDYILVSLVFPCGRNKHEDLGKENGKGQGICFGNGLCQLMLVIWFHVSSS